MRRMFALLVSLWLALPAAAQVPVGGYLIAKRACEATVSLRGGDARAPVPLEPERAYRLVGENKADGSHLLIEVPGAEPVRRWVEKGCGERVTANGSAPTSVAAAAAASAEVGRAGMGARGVSTRNILAISWQPAFCEGQPRKAECRLLTADRPEAGRFSLHGLWPQPREREYCGDAALGETDKAGRWGDLPAPELSAETRRRLDDLMPGARSHLDRHEWVRHGTCFGGGAETYFGASIRLLEAVNASPVGRLFASRVGKEISAREIRAAFDEGFGHGAGERVRISCRDDGDRRLVVELTIGLSGEIGPGTPLADLIGAASPTRPGCPAGIVDPAGAQ